jgi:hypothetical protein
VIDSELQALVQRGRANAETKMIDRCEIRLPSTTSKSVDPVTGKHTTIPGAVVYTGKCKRQSPPGVRAELDVDSGDRATTLSRLQVHIPSSAPPIQKNAVITMTACPLEPTSVGRRFLVAGPAGKTMASAQRLNVTEVIG